MKKLEVGPGASSLRGAAEMKVALVIEKFSPAGGAERQCVYLARDS